ncbi:xanthine dehydrogenase accessory protein XdhC [Kineosporia sp. J2-2]|uniref:Xanthine dehydrogenase accessory protein XdhC n=1 Tax=Kineosporia corallincola TaxID=2835133 RepID=A0ABS5TQZ3_9ACTN|nr:xanthine dehydrogenase accessory protein XdhC [Kineosporia corallincola]MBT0773204.1 xanthine dehydrogenase accessory protein XdhC [Kineosporia corallincola]
MDWLSGIEQLRRRHESGVLVTVAAVRGHAPREAGAKMLVSQHETWGTVGGGNLEAVAIERARGALPAPELITLSLNDKVPTQHGVQCCGGEVTLLLEPLNVAPAVAIFGIGHVGMELARIMARHDLDLHLVDTRAGQLSPERLAPLHDARARVRVHAVPIAPEQVLAELPQGTHVLVMTHDHAEDLAICDQALRTARVGSIGLIGSTAKRGNFRRRLEDAGHPDPLSRIRCPVGIPTVTGKNPATVAVSVAAELLVLMQAELRTPEPLAAPRP